MKRKLVMAMVMAGVLTMVPVNFGTANTVQAALPSSGEVVQPRYVNTINISANLVITGNTAHCYADATAKKSCHISIVMRLQRKDGSSWNTICSWVGSADSVTKSLDQTFSLSTHGTYRVHAEFNVGGEAISCNSPTKTY